jgi:hydrogenase expression/formation protein HypC
MQVRSVLPSGAARCSTRDSGRELHTVEASLLDNPPRAGDWLLVHVDVAVRALDADEAQQIGDALEAVAAAAAGAPFEHLIADLIDREPELPAHLKDQVAGEPQRG